MLTKNRRAILFCSLLITCSYTLEVKAVNMKNNDDYVSREELAYLESYIFSAKAGVRDFSLALMFSDRDKMDEFEKNSQSYLSNKSDADLIKEGLIIYQKVIGVEMADDFIKALHDETNENIKKLQSDKERINQIINDSSFNEGELLLENLQKSSGGLFPTLTKELNKQQFSTLLWLSVVDKNYNDHLSMVYEWLMSSDPDVKKRKHHIALAQKMNKALQNDDISTVKKLIDQGLDISQANYPIEEFPLKVAAINASVGTLSFILEMIPYTEIATLDGWIESINLAVDSNKYDKVGILVNALSASTWAVEEFWPPLMDHAWIAGDPASMEFLVDLTPAKVPIETLYKIIDSFLVYPYRNNLIKAHQKTLARLLKKAPDYNKSEGDGAPAMSALIDKNYLLLELLISHQNDVFQSEPEFIASKARLVQVAAYKEDLRALKLFHKHGANLVESERGEDSLSILGGRILYSNMELTTNKQKVIDYLISLNIPLVLNNNKERLESLIQNYAEHRKISEAQAAAFLMPNAELDK